MVRIKAILGLLCAVSLLAGADYVSAEKAATDKLSSELQQLITCEDPDKTIKVTIVTVSGFPEITERYVLKDIKRHGKLISAVVSVDDLASLSAEKEVEYIRRPRRFWRW